MGRIRLLMYVLCGLFYPTFLSAQRDAAHAVTVGIVGNLGLDAVDGNDFKNCLHRLLGIHRDGGRSIGADDGSRAVLPLLKAIAEVLDSLQRNGCPLFELLHVRVTADAASLY